MNYPVREGEIFTLKLLIVYLYSEKISSVGSRVMAEVVKDGTILRYWAGFSMLIVYSYTLPAYICELPEIFTSYSLFENTGHSMLFPRVSAMMEFIVKSRRETVKTGSSVQSRALLGLMKSNSIRTSSN